MAKLTFLGGVGTATGSGFLIEIDGKKYLTVECRMTEDECRRMEWLGSVFHMN